ncbi:hypothetical protein [Verrucomicrobium sp. BvORR034]|uniref:hypothetical protein n=1 Tax=Verrucomicrobium sp. BvORR034 TaxID=1396418 RepID=UPI000679C81A|nr:hypothetical protein [Verrucomicrobium sp. BvORR034]
MTQYILLIQDNLTGTTTAEEWTTFFSAVHSSGMFKGGSEIGDRIRLGNSTTAQSTDHVVAYMRFDSEDKEKLLALVNQHPVILHGGTVELCELPKS